MGGGIRAAIKLATYGFNVGLRGASSIPLQDQLSTPVRRASSKQNAVTASSVVVSSSSSSKDGKTTDGSLHNKPSWEIDDWEFSGDEVEEMLLLDSMDPMPRVVFRGGVPTLEEATEATADVKEALEKEYFSNAIRCKNSSTAQDSALLSSGYSETKACITSESVMGHSSVPTPVFQAFSLLKESPEAQGVVASLALDKNVWDAVMQNEKVMEYIKKQQQLSALSDDDTDMKQPFSVDEKGTEGVYSGSGFMEFVDKVKITVTDIVSSLSGFFHSIFGGSIEDRISMDANGAAAVKTGVGASFMALAVLTVIVAVLKRG